MEEKEFNLLDEPWIRVMDARCGVEEVSITDALINAHKYRALCGELPTQDAAILRLLLAVLHTVFSRVDAEGNERSIKNEDDAVEAWKELWKSGRLPENPIRRYLEKWHERFWLFHPERPFAQAAELTYGTAFGSPKLNGEVSESGNTIRLFSAYSGDGKKQLTYSQAARWLIHINSADDSAAKPSKEGKAASPTGKLESAGTGWFGKIGLTMLKGENLFQTLLLNLVLVDYYEAFQTECPLWERDKITLEEAKEINRLDNLAELYTTPYRKIKLIREENRVEGFYEIKGEFFSDAVGMIEPMTAWQKKKKPERIVPYMHQFNKQMWRDFSVLFLQASEESYSPQVVKWYNTLLNNDDLDLELPEFICMEIVGIEYGDKKSKITNIFSDSLSFHAEILSELGEALRVDIQDEIKKCERLADAIGELAVNLYFASGGNESDSKEKRKEDAIRKSAKEQLYYRLDMPFREWLRSIKPDEDGFVAENTFPDWQKTAKHIALSYAEEQCNHAGNIAMTGHMIKNKLYSAPKAMILFRNQVSKIYQKVR